MQEKIHAIILRTVKYGENDLIVSLFTREHGHMSVITKKTKSTKGHASSLVWIPLNFVEFDTTIRPSGKLPKPKNAHPYILRQQHDFDPAKSALNMFLAEFMSYALNSETENSSLYDWLEMAFQWLDNSTGSYANFHIVFLINISRFIGIYPNIEDFSPLKYFDLQAGAYRDSAPPHPHYLPPEESRMIPLYFRMNYSNMHLFRLSRKQRLRCIEILCLYFQLHVPGFRELKSLSILKELFD